MKSKTVVGVELWGAEFPRTVYSSSFWYPGSPAASSSNKETKQQQQRLSDFSTCCGIIFVDSCFSPFILLVSLIVIPSARSSGTLLTQQRSTCSSLYISRVSQRPSGRLLLVAFNIVLFIFSQVVGIPPTIFIFNTAFVLLLKIVSDRFIRVYLSKKV